MKLCSKAVFAAAILLIAFSEISVIYAESADTRNDATEYTIAANLLANTKIQEAYLGE